MCTLFVYSTAVIDWAYQLILIVFSTRLFTEILIYKLLIHPVDCLSLESWATSCSKFGMQSLLKRLRLKAPLAGAFIMRYSVAGKLLLMSRPRIVFAHCRGGSPDTYAFTLTQVESWRRKVFL